MEDEEPPCGTREYFEIGAASITRLIKDPVCGRAVDKRTAVARGPKQGPRCYFCSLKCLALYYLDPRRYLRGGS
ncbi:MAG: YHS domain-containing protein [Elusimicrobia bacterium]|nr:YHS domain-containing protein [Elusimicrobiota bacterium]